jgi:uncharacterized alkaline shock family protein YloU
MSNISRGRNPDRAFGKGVQESICHGLRKLTSLEIVAVGIATVGIATCINII